jgi:ApaG protein
MTNKAIAQGIQILCKPRYLPAESSPINEVYTFAYTITVINRSEHTVQLLSRRWLITDEDMEEEEVEGEGVVGHQPTLQPGQGFEYTSGCRLRTPRGRMEGAYTFIADGAAEDTFSVPIPKFELDATGTHRA